MFTQPFEVVVGGDFSGQRVSVDDHDSAAGLLHKRGVVGRVGPLNEHPAKHLGPERLGCLHGAQQRPWRGGNYRAGIVNDFDGVDDGDSRNGTVGPVGDGPNKSINDFDGHERSGGVVHEDDRRSGPDSGQTGTNRICPGRPAANDDASARFRIINPVGCDDEDDPFAATLTHQCQRVVKNPAAAKRQILLGDTSDPVPKPQPGAGRDDDGPDFNPARRGRRHAPSMVSHENAGPARINKRRGRKPALGQGVGELLLRRLFVDIQREGQLRHKDLAGLDEHALFAGGQSLVFVANRQVTNHFGHLVDVA